MLIVKKFGGTSVANKERIFNVARRCIEDYKAGHDVVVVLSAMGDTTDELIELANSINPDAKKRNSVEDTSPTSPDTMRTLHFPHTPFPLHGLSINMFCASKISRRLAPGS